MKRTNLCMYMPLAVLLVALGVATAQVDERARELLAGAEQSATVPEYQSLEQTSVTTIFHPDGNVQSESRTHLVIDLANRRFASTSFMDGEAVSKIVYADGEAKAFFSGMDTVMPLPAEQAEAFETLLDQPQSLIPTDYESARYEGVQSYAGMIEGEQVTVAQSVNIPGLAMPAELKLLFDGEGRIIGSVSEVPGTGTVLSIYEVAEGSVEGSGFATGLSFTIYLLEGDQATLFMRTRVEKVVLDEPLDEDLFELEMMEKAPGDSANPA